MQLGSHPVAVVQYTYTQTIQGASQNRQYIEQHKKYIETTQQLERVWAVPHLCGFYPGICLTTEEKARKNLSQGKTSPQVKVKTILNLVTIYIEGVLVMGIC
jgi:hypothetical protein